MQKKYYIWIVVAVFIVLVGVLLLVNKSKAPELDQEENGNQQKVIPVEFDLGNDLNFEEDVDDLDVGSTELKEFDESDFDIETIDNDIL